MTVLRLAFLSFVFLTACAIDADVRNVQEGRVGECTDKSVTERYFDRFDNDIFFPRSKQRVFDLYLGRVTPKQNVDGAIDDIWLLSQFATSDLQCWHRKGDKLASFALALIEYRSSGFTRNARTLFGVAARANARTCRIDPALRSSDAVDSCFEGKVASPYFVGIPAAHYFLYLCHIRTECDFSPEDANYHKNSAVRLGVFEAQPQQLGDG